MPYPRLVSTKRYSPISTAACAYKTFCKRILNSWLHIQHLLSVRSTQPVVPHISQESLGCKKLLPSTLPALQGKQDAKHRTAETILSDKLFYVQNEKKQLLKKIDQLQCAWQEDVKYIVEVLIALVCFANACCI